MIESVYETLPAPYAAKAISECRRRGARIAIATAEPCPDFNTRKQQRFLDSIGIEPEDMRFCDTCGYYGDAKICTSAGGGMCKSIPNKYKNSPPYNHDDTICTGVSQHSDSAENNFGSIKRPMLEEIIKGTDPSKVIFFDDQIVNREMTDTIGIKTQSASDNCHGKSCPDGTGLTKKNFEDGMAMVGGTPEICIFDIDNTLTMGSNASAEQVEDKQLLSILTILILLAIIALLVR
jgi:hypothetical protein